MFASIAAWLVAKRLVSGPASEKAAKVIVGVGVAVALALAAWAALAIHDRRVLARDALEREAAAAKASLEGERRANAAEEEAQDGFDEEQDKLERNSNDEIEKDPAGAAKPVGPGQRGYFDGLPKRGAD